jgi:hypothetical protein
MKHGEPRQNQRRGRQAWLWFGLGGAALGALGLLAWRQDAALRAELAARDRWIDYPVAAQAVGLSDSAREAIRYWNAPDEGRLGGAVVGLDDFGVVLEDFDGSRWFIEALPGAVPGRDDAAVFLARVRVTGEMVGEGVFRAAAFEAWPE